MFATNYIEFVAILFLPGIALVEALEVGKSLSLAERLGLALGLGASIDMLIVLFQSSGYLAVSVVNLSVAIASVSAAIILASALLRRKISLFAKPSRTDLAVGLLVVIQGLLVFAHFSKYPIFPEFRSIDFYQHVQVVDTLLKSGTTLSYAELYDGVYMFMIQLIAITGGPPFIMVQRTIEILVVLSPLLFYAAASSLNESKSIPIVATFLYVVGGFVWFGSAFNVGLYPNFYGILSTLLIIVAASLMLKEPRRPVGWLVYLVAMANAIFSHYSTLTIFPAIAILPIIELVLSRKLNKRLVVVALLPVVLVGATLFAFPGIIDTLGGFIAAQRTNNISADTTLSAILVGFPFLRYLVIEITGDFSTVLILLMAVVGGAVTLKRKNPFAWIPLVWLLSVAAVSPQSEAAWRFSYAGLMPLCLLASTGFTPLLKRPLRTSAVRRRKGRGKLALSLRTLAPVGILVFMVGGTWGTMLVADALTSNQLNARAQHGVYSSMLWLANNTPPDSGILSVTDFRYLYTSLIANRNQGYSPLITPDEVVQQLGKNKDVYVVLTRVWTLPNASINPFPMYENDARFNLVYQNFDVLIYRLNSTIIKPSG